MKVIQAPRKRRTSSKVNELGPNGHGPNELSPNELSPNEHGPDQDRTSSEDGLKEFIADSCHASEFVSSLDDPQQTPKSSHKPSAIHKSVDLLSRREHSVQELHDKLLSKGYSDSEVDAALQYLKSEDLVSDDRFTEAYIRMRVEKGYGPSKIRMELDQRGVNSGLIDAHLDFQDEYWWARATQAYEKKFGESAPHDFKEWSRRARFMQSRGFTSSIIRQVCPDIEHSEA